MYAAFRELSDTRLTPQGLSPRMTSWMEVSIDRVSLRMETTVQDVFFETITQRGPTALWGSRVLKKEAVYCCSEQLNGRLRRQHFPGHKEQYE